MFKALRVSDAGIKQARQHEAIRGKKIMARGAFSAVFDNGDTVLKLTLDQYAYMLGTDQVIGCHSQHFTRVLHNYGEVGEVDGHHVYLFECEKLEKLPKGGEARALARRICKQATTHANTHLRFHRKREGLVLAIEELSMDEVLPESLQEGFADLHKFTSNVEEGWGLDLHSANLMVRPSNGTLVLSDPLADVATRDALAERRYMRAAREYANRH
jgi:hypothetical protein